jgi:serine phosphatase RsbU (regulator of sigma subunit)
MVQQFNRALSIYRKALEVADSIGALEQQMNAILGMHLTYKKKKQYRKALQWHKRYHVLKDSIFNKQKQKKIGRMEARYEWHQQQIKDSLQHAQQMQVQKLKHRQEIQQQRYILYGTGGGLLLMLIFAGILYNRFRVTHHQKNVIEQQNKEITSSLNYAKHIQDALLKEEKHIPPALPPHFILYKPHSIVSGDFYWSVLNGDELYVGVAD